MSDTATTTATASNGLQSEEAGRARPYVVLEQGVLIDFVSELFKEADIGLNEDEWAQLKKAASASRQVYIEVARKPSRNAAHALTQVGRQYEAGITPPLIAVSERMFRPRQVNVSFDPKVSLS